MNNGLNWIGGRWCAAASGLTFACSEVRDASGEPGERQGNGGESFVRSGDADVEQAVQCARDSSAAWNELGFRRRMLQLEGLIRDLCEDYALADLGPRIGLSGRAYSRHLPGFGELQRYLVTLAAPVTPAREQRDGAHSGVELVAHRPHWTELVRGTLRPVLHDLAQGSVVLLFTDAALPHIGEALARAAERAALPGGVLQVLHGDHREAVASFARSNAGRVVIGAGPTEAAAWSRFLGTAGARLLLRPLVNRTTIVRGHDDPAAAAARVARLAFGAGASLGGLRPGSVARVVCDARCFSEFTERLLEELEGGSLRASSGGLLAALPQESAAQVATLRRLGLDEGATLIHEGQAARASREGRGADKRAVNGEQPDSAGASGRRRSRAGTSSATVARYVFTNVEVNSGLAAQREPVPVLNLIRAQDDAEALLLVRRLDSDAVGGKPGPAGGRGGSSSGPLVDDEELED